MMTMMMVNLGRFEIRFNQEKLGYRSTKEELVCPRTDEEGLMEELQIFPLQQHQPRGEAFGCCLCFILAQKVPTLHAPAVQPNCQFVMRRKRTFVEESAIT